MNRGQTPDTFSSLTLDRITPGTSVRIVALAGGRRSRQKLFDLGFVPGQEIKVMRREEGGPILVSHGGRTTALGRGLAEKVRVVITARGGFRRWGRRGG
jgi:ferrous iron transport protein A